GPAWRRNARDTAWIGRSRDAEPAGSGRDLPQKGAETRRLSRRAANLARWLVITLPDSRPSAAPEPPRSARRVGALVAGGLRPGRRRARPARAVLPPPADRSRHRTTGPGPGPGGRC